MGVVADDNAIKMGLKVPMNLLLLYGGSVLKGDEKTGIITCDLLSFPGIYLQHDHSTTEESTRGSCSSLSVIGPTAVGNKEILATFAVTTRFNPGAKKSNILEFYTEIGKTLDAGLPVAGEIAHMNKQFTELAANFLKIVTA